MIDKAGAFVVGVEQYSHPMAPSLPTPCKDAIRIAVQLQQMGVSPEKTFVFLEPILRSGTDKDEFELLRATLKPGTQVTESCTYQTLDTFWRHTLRAIPKEPNSCLLLYWCGHGFTDARAGLPYLLCSDWTDVLATRLLNRAELLNSLHSDPYLKFSSQLILFDACANNMAAKVIPGVTDEGWNGDIDQACIASAARGQYAHGDANGGHFTRTVLNLLATYGDWPNLDDFSTRLRETLKTEGQKSSLVRYSRGQGDEEVWRTSNPARDTLVSLLKGVDLAPTKYKPLYLLVVSTLSAEPGRGAGITIDQMIDDLWNANGSAAASTAPYPVVEFALRVHDAFPAAEAPLATWLGNRAFVTNSNLAEAKGQVSDLDNWLFLVVELHESKSSVRTGEIEKFSAHLLRFDHARSVEPWTVAEQQSSWDDLAEHLRPLVQAARKIASTLDARLTVEFVTNVFDIDPHRFEIDDKSDVLGEKHPVVLRWRTQRSRDMRQPWLDQAEAIRLGKTKVCIHGIRTSQAKLEPCQVLFVRHALAPGSHPKHPQPLTPEWKLVRRAISAGVPFICWPLRDTGTVECGDYETDLETWVNESCPIDTVPARVRQERVTNSLATNMNVFWDDPLPTWQLREIRTR